ncbi:ribosomal protein RPL31, partial [Cardiosporidium cionae]
DVRIDTMLNKIIWSEGIRNVPRRLRVRIARKANVDELSTEKMFTLVQYVSVDSFKGLKTNVIDLEFFHADKGHRKIQAQSKWNLGSSIAKGMDLDNFARNLQCNSIVIGEKLTFSKHGPI